MRLAIPLANGKMCQHFGHCEVFALIEVDPESRAITHREDLVPPPHQPGLLPAWIAGQDVGVVIAGGMGRRAQALFEGHGIEVVVGAPPEGPEELVNAYLRGSLATGENVCDH